MMEKTLVILKPCTLQRGLVGEITNRFERNVRPCRDTGRRMKCSVSITPI